MSLTPWSRAVLKMMIVAQLGKKFHAFYGTEQFIAVFKKVHHWSLS
jgi:hypothetical protein